MRIIDKSWNIKQLVRMHQSPNPMGFVVRLVLDVTDIVSWTFCVQKLWFTRAIKQNKIKSTCIMLFTWFVSHLKRWLNFVSVVLRYEETRIISKRTHSHCFYMENWTRRWKKIKPWPSWKNEVFVMRGREVNTKSCNYLQGFINVSFFCFLDERENRVFSLSSKKQKKETLMNPCYLS